MHWALHPCISVCQDEWCILQWGSGPVMCCVLPLHRPPPLTLTNNYPSLVIGRWSLQQRLTLISFLLRYHWSVVGLGGLWLASGCYHDINHARDMCPDIWLWFPISQPLINALEQHSFMICQAHAHPGADVLVPRGGFVFNFRPPSLFIRILC